MPTKIYKPVEVVVMRRQVDILTLTRSGRGPCDPLDAYITLGSPCENGFSESFNERLRDELLDGEIFYTLLEA